VFRGVEYIKTAAAAHEARRACRFTLQMPVRYRLGGERGWRHGKTENVSRSGVLFRSQSAAEAGASLELCLILPALSSGTAAQVICRGVVARSVPPQNGDLPALAVRILNSRLVRE
jgi:hypothetical protein